MIQESIRRHRRRKRMVQGILVAIVIFAAVATILFFSTDLTRITVTGTTYIPQETAAQMVFSTRMEKRTFYARFCDLFGRKKDLPMIRSYELIFDGMNAVTVEVEEEPVVRGIRYVDSYLYFDQEGYLLSSGKEPIEDVVLLEGIVIRQPMLYKQIQTEEQELFEGVLEVTRLMEGYGIRADVISCGDDNTIALLMDTVTVKLGNVEHMEGKLSELRFMQADLEGLRGTLYLDTYGEQGSTGSYIFERD